MPLFYALNKRVYGPASMLENVNTQVRRARACIPKSGVQPSSLLTRYFHQVP